MKQAEWNNITWGVVPGQLALINKLSLSQEVDTEEKESNNGAKKIVLKGLKSEELSVSYSSGFVIGTDPRGEFEMLKKCAGMQDEFLLAGRPLSNSNFELNEITLENIKISNTGQILTGELTLNFNTEQKTSSKGGKSKKKKGKKKGSTKKKGSLTLNPADFAKAKSMANKK